MFDIVSKQIFLKKTAFFFHLLFTFSLGLETRKTHNIIFVLKTRYDIFVVYG